MRMKMRMKIRMIKGMKKLIAFMSKNLRDSEPNYTIMEKQSYALVKSLKHF